MVVALYGLVVLQKHQTSVLPLNGDPLYDLLDFVEVGGNFLRLYLLDRVFVLGLSLFKEVQVFLLDFLDVLLHNLVFRHVDIFLGFRQLLQEEKSFLLFGDIVLEHHKNVFSLEQLLRVTHLLSYVAFVFGDELRAWR